MEGYPLSSVLPRRSDAVRSLQLFDDCDVVPDAFA